MFLFCWFAFSFGQIGKDRLLEIEKFIQKEKYNSDLAIFIDFRIPSNKNRFFLYSFKRQRILEKGLVAHGAGSEKAHLVIQKILTNLLWGNMKLVKVIQGCLGNLIG